MEFVGFLSVSEIFATPELVPEEPGVYAISIPMGLETTFLKCGTGGRYRGKEPTVSLERLHDEWVSGAAVLYFGQTGSDTSKGTLRSRTRLLLRFGRSQPCSHWGGRLIWQLKESDQLLLSWLADPVQKPKVLKKAMIADFKAKYGKRPFANLRDW